MTTDGIRLRVSSGAPAAAAGFMWMASKEANGVLDGVPLESGAESK
jgi:hypothetical protein